MREKRFFGKEKKLWGIFFSLCALLGPAACTNMWAVTSAEEYYAIGMAYFDNGKYAEAEKWLSRAKSMDKTKTASEYNLGRIAFETKRYAEAFRYFNGILAKDPQNVMALKAAAYTKVKLGDLDEASRLYGRVLALTPESADDGYNYALILFVMEKYDECSGVLAKYPFALLENSDVILLNARLLRIQDKSEAMDWYARWLENNSNSQVRYEYALILEDHGFYARALEQCRTALKDLPPGSKEPKKADVRFRLARLLLIADPDNDEGLTELRGAIAEGFDNIEELSALADRDGLANKDELRRIAEETETAKKAREAQTPPETP
jgi:tetratricopeptide (TPR) repeat protein